MSVFDSEPSSAAAADAAKRRRAGRRRIPRAVWILLAVVIFVLSGSLVVGALYATSIARSVSQNLERSDLMPPDAPPSTAGRPAAEDPAAGEPAAGGAARPAKRPDSRAINYVLLGSDSRTADAGNGRSDVLMVLHLAGDRRSAYAVSFPRDLWVRIPDRGNHKINAAFAFGGPQLTIRTLENLLGTRMDHVALIDFEGFIGLTEDLGGVRVFNDHESTTGGHHFPVGEVTLRGEQALSYVRERKQLPRGDLDRAERQRNVLQAILAKGLSRETITDPGKFLSFTSGAAKHVTVDSQLSDAELRDTALSLRMGRNDLHLLQAPITGFGWSADRQSIALPDRDQLAELAKALRDDDMASYLEDHPNG